ncbi:MAG TPA: hypothetical protein VFE51_29700 [Verrucomicrobiae bacterium]|nr:hypothetical protein [Verrucomicrobiae bacterium]
MKIAYKCELSSTDPVPYGEQEGTPMQDLLAAYLNFLWESWQTSPAWKRALPVRNYIQQNLAALRAADATLTWS